MENIETAIAELNKEQYIPRSIEFTVQEDFAKNLPQIVSNLAEVKAWAEQQTKSDREIVLLTEEDFDNARERCAKLNKMIKFIEDKRKEVKKEYNRPYDVFEKATKEVVEVLSSAREHQWSQVIKAEEEVKEQKKQCLHEYWEKLNSEAIGGYRKFEQIFDTKWLNKGTKVETACAEMDKIFETSVSDVMAIRSLNSEFEVSLIEYYKDGHNVSEVIAYNNRLQAQKQAQIEREEQIKANTQPKQETTNLPQKNEPVFEIEQEELISMQFEVVCTHSQLTALGNYMKQNGIKYGRIKN